MVQALVLQLFTRVDDRIDRELAIPAGRLDGCPRLVTEHRGRALLRSRCPKSVESRRRQAVVVTELPHRHLTNDRIEPEHSITNNTRDLISHA